MPALDVENPGVPAVSSVEKLLEDLLGEASLAKQAWTVEPVLNASDFKDLSSRISATFPNDAASGEDGNAAPQEAAKTRHFAIIETAARDLFDKLIVRQADLGTLHPRLIVLGRYPNRLPRVRQDVEFPRHSLDSIR